MHRSWDIRLVIIQWPWNPGWRSHKVIENDTIQSGTHDFLLTFHSNRQPISHHIWDKRWFPPKIANFSHPRVFCTTAERVTLRIGYWCRGQKKLELMGIPDGQKVFKIGLTIYTRTIPVCDRQTCYCCEDHAMLCIAQVKTVLRIIYPYDMFLVQASINQ